jgi:hypothetical protein
MTDYTVIFEAGESLVELFRAEMSPEPIAQAEHIGLCEPQEPEDFRLTVWVYGIEESKDTGARAGYVPDPSNPQIERYAPMQLKLHALVSAHSKASAMQKHADRYRIIGKAMQLIRDNPSIPRKYIQGTLAEQSEPVLMEIVKLNSEEMSRIWNNSNKTIVPSFGVDISQIMMSSNRVRKISSRVTSAEFETKIKKENRR